jgi:N-acetylglucosamine-6-sulfatase
VLALVSLGLAAASCTEATSPKQPETSVPTTSSIAPGRALRPNVLVLLTDDQASGLFTRDLMPNVFSRIVDQGVNFTRAYVNDSQCCPSRVSILTGLYAHHSGVDSNSIPLAGVKPERPTIAAALQGAGYRTILAGKYLNSEPCDPHPGWDEWVCATREAQRNPTLNIDGKTERPRGYTTDILARSAIDFISHSTDPHHPFFVYYAPRSPHLPATDERSGSLPVPPSRPPSYGAPRDPTSRPRWARVPPLTPTQKKQVDTRHRLMTRQIPPLDDAIGTILDAVERRSDQTMVIFMSDNGFLYGEHGLTDKNVPYEESVRVPLAIRYPALLPASGHVESDALVSNVDVAPTIMDAAEIPWGADGVSLLPVVRGERASLRTGLLVEWCEAGNDKPCRSSEDAALVRINLPAYVAIETERHVYIRYATKEKELYDLREDPFQMTNLASDPGSKSLVAQLDSRLTTLMAEPTRPGTTIASGPVGTISGRTATFTFFSQSRTSSLQCVLSGPGHHEGWEPCQGGTISYDRLSQGSYVFTVRATAEDGAMDRTPARRKFSVSI